LRDEVSAPTDLNGGQGASSLGAIGNNDAQAAKTQQQREDGEGAGEAADPLEGMSEQDKWGLKGFRVLMHNYPDYSAMMTGMDPAELGLDLSTTEWVVFIYP
jgi:CCR4-NOT transcription complex subunit 2